MTTRIASAIGSSRPPTAWAAAHSRDLDPGDWGAEGGGLPPGYVKSYDEGRPRK